MTFWSESNEQVFVNRCEMHSVIQWKQNCSDDEITEKIPNDDLHITELTAVNPSRNRYKGDSRQ